MNSLRGKISIFVHEIIMPIMLVMIVPNGALMLLWDVNSFTDVFKVSVLSLVISVAVFHLYFWNRKSESSKNLIRYIDYIYLIVASAGLLSAADFSQKEYKNELQLSINQAINYIEGANRVYEAHEKNICKQPNSEVECQAIRAAIKEGTSAVGVLRHTPILHNLINSTKRYKAVTDNIKTKPSFIEHNFDGPDNLIRIAERLSAQPFGFDDLNFGEQVYAGWKRLGFLLLAAALGLRITRVSIELFEWTKEGQDKKITRKSIDAAPAPDIANSSTP